jgi:hypothetical protein
MTNQDTSTAVSGILDIFRAAIPAQWQAAKQRPTQFGDSKTVPAVKVRQYEPSPEDDMERDRR